MPTRPDRNLAPRRKLRVEKLGSSRLTPGVFDNNNNNNPTATAVTALSHNLGPAWGWVGDI